jgi:uncharacterized membrane protein
VSEIVDTPVNGPPSLFGVERVSIRWRLLFPTLCWSINTKSMKKTFVRHITSTITLLRFVFILFENVYMYEFRMEIQPSGKSL